MDIKIAALRSITLPDPIAVDSILINYIISQSNESNYKVLGGKMPVKVDFKKELKAYYNPSITGYHLVDVPAMNFLMVDGAGNPNTSKEYQQAVEVLYAMSYAIKFSLKSRGYDHVIPPLEGLWWMENMDEFSRANIERWEWTMMIMQPDWVALDLAEGVRSEVAKKKELSSLSKVRYGSLTEGAAVQVRYIGGYDNEAPVIADMHAFIRNNGFKMNGKHHEVYLSDPRKVTAEKLKTILRQPIRRE
jgi:hypothetical protein